MGEVSVEGGESLSSEERCVGMRCIRCQWLWWCGGVRGRIGRVGVGERKGEVDVCGVSWSRSDVAQDFTGLLEEGTTAMTARSWDESVLEAEIAARCRAGIARQRKNAEGRDVRRDHEIDRKKDERASRTQTFA